MSLVIFMDTIYGTPIKGIGEDKICWKPHKKKGFKVSGYHQLLVGTNDQCFPWKRIWKPKVLPKIAFFVWIAALGKF